VPPGRSTAHPRFVGVLSSLRGDGLTGAQPCGQQLLALLGALLALGLSTPEEVGELIIASLFGIAAVLLQAQGVVQGCLGEPDDVVVLVCR